MRHCHLLLLFSWKCYSMLTASSNSKAMGSRKLVKTHQETKKVKKIVDGEEREVDKQ